MAGFNTMCAKIHLVVAVLLVVTIAKVCGMMNCSDQGDRDQCCYATSVCPSGTFEDICDVTSPTVPTTTTSQTFPTTTEADNSTTDVDTSTSDSTMTTDDYNSTTESDNVSSSTGPVATSTARGISCRRCEENCANCSATTCFQCKDEYILRNGKCDEKFPIAAVAGGAAGGFVLIIVVVVLAVCCCKNRRRNTTTLDRMLEERQTSTDEECPDPQSSVVPVVSNTSVSIHPNYENLGFIPDDLPTKIEQGQDKMFRYTKDPTYKKPQEPADSVDENVYGNQSTIELQKEVDELPEAPLPPGSQQKETVPTRRVPEVEEEPQEIYCNESAMEMMEADPEDYEEEQVYYNDPDSESPYVNVQYR